jgi:hypothetical protein
MEGVVLPLAQINWCCLNLFGQMGLNTSFHSSLVQETRLHKAQRGYMLARNHKELSIVVGS